MKHFWKANIYEIQTILYWVLGCQILWNGSWKWVGWLSIMYGWTTAAYTMVYVWKNKEALKRAFED